MLLDELATFLQTQGVGTVGTTIFKGDAPNKPDLVMVLREYGGPAPLETHDSGGINIEQPRVQVLTRGAPGGYVAARSMAEDAYRALPTVANQMLSGTTYLRIWCLQAPFAMPHDDNDRPRIVFNIAILKGLSV